VLVCTLATGPAHASAGTRKARAKVFALVNRYRVSHGVPKLREKRTVDRIAWRHSEQMAQKRTLFHTSNMWTKLRTYHPAVWGENVGVGPSAWSVFSMWKRSASHRANMLNRRFRCAGVGVVFSHGSYWITMIYYG